MARLIRTENDFGEPYKTFNELQDGDKVYIVKVEDISILNGTVKNYKKEDKSDYWSHNYTMVEFELPDLKLNDNEFTIYDGNSFIYEQYNDNLFIVSDKRIADILCRVLYMRNHCQWAQFTSIFGNPMSRYADKPVILG